MMRLNLTFTQRPSFIDPQPLQSTPGADYWYRRGQLTVYDGSFCVNLVQPWFPDSWSNTILGVSEKVFFGDRINIYVNRL